MALLAMLAALMLSLLGHSLATVIEVASDAQLKSSIIRRHPDHGLEGSVVIVSSSGELIQESQEPGITYCNHDFIKGTENSNTCPSGSTPIAKPATCAHAAGYLKASDGFVAMGGGPPSATFTVNNDWVADATLPYPKNCFAMANGSVFFNPSEPTPTNFSGTPICMRQKFPKGGDNDGTETGGCPADFEPIRDYSSCMAAFECDEGNAGCMIPDFENNANFVTKKAPKGCYRETNGCFNFNKFGGAISELGTVTGTPVCKLTATATATTATATATAT